MDLNTSPLPEDDEEYYEQDLVEHPVERVTQHDHESSVQLLRRVCILCCSISGYLLELLAFEALIFGSLVWTL